MRIRFGPFTLDLESRQLTNAGEEIHLEPKAFELLSALVLERPKVLSKADLQERLWPGTFVAEANLSNLVAEIRAALGDPARAPRFVRTAHGVGYAFCGQAEPLIDPIDAVPVPEAPRSRDGLVSELSAVSPPPRSNRLPWLVAGVLGIGLIGTAIIALRRDGGLASGAGLAQFTVAPPENATFGGPIRGGSGAATQLAVSPDGRHIAFVARTGAAYQIWLRPVATLEATPIPGTEGGTFPFWSPDGRSIGFFANSRLKTVQIAGGPPIALADAPTSMGGSWNRDNVILFAPGAPQHGLWRVSSAGGVPTRVTSLDTTAGEDAHRWPHFLPDGRHFFYTAVTGVCCPASTPAIVRIGSLDRPGEDVTLFQAESSVSYASGHVIFAHDETLMARPFDLETRQLQGDAFPLAERVSTEGSRYVGASASESGTLVYGQAAADVPRQLTWFDRTGHVLGTVGDAARYVGLALSPDERRVAVTLETGTPENVDIWLIDIDRDIRSRLTVHPGADVSPVWSPDGTRIAFQSSRSRQPVALRQMLSDGAGGDELLLERAGNFTMTPTAWSKDGFIAYTSRGSDVWILPLFGDRKPFAFVETPLPFLEAQAVFSPDGRWIAYMSNEGGQRDVYVQSFPGPGPRTQVSKDGGTHPVWRADGRELFYLASDGTMMAVAVGAGRSFDAGLPRALFSSNVWRLAVNQVYAVTKDGQRFLVNAVPQKHSDAAPLTVVLNWQEELSSAFPRADVNSRKRMKVGGFVGRMAAGASGEIDSPVEWCCRVSSGLHAGHPG